MCHAGIWGGEKVGLHSFLTTALDGVEWSLNAIIALPPVGGRQSQSGCFGGAKNLLFYQTLNPRSSSL